MKYINSTTFKGERSLFMSSDLFVEGCTFIDGESPLKESKNIELQQCEFKWKYPLWYCENIKGHNVTWFETARSGVWYTRHIEINDCQINAPKQFRRCEDINLINVNIPNAQETFWNCSGIKARSLHATGDYFGMNSQDIEIDQLFLNGNYAFDGGKNIIIRDSVLNSKDAFWNCENVTLVNCVINGEYLGWNSKNLTFVNCKIMSHQGLCYISNLKMIGCELNDSDLCFEFCSDIDASINSVVDSIKNPYSGKIIVKGVNKLILENDKIDASKTEIIIGEKIYF